MLVASDDEHEPALRLLLDGVIRTVSARFATEMVSSVVTKVPGQSVRSRFGKIALSCKVPDLGSATLLTSSN